MASRDNERPAERPSAPPSIPLRFRVPPNSMDFAHALLARVPLLPEQGLGMRWLHEKTKLQMERRFDENSEERKTVVEKKLDRSKTERQDSKQKRGERKERNNNETQIAKISHPDMPRGR